MREKKFTAGPWVKDYKSTTGHIKSVNDGAHLTPTVIKYKNLLGENNADNEHSFYATSISDSEREANAHLIAAAPELLEALEWLDDCIKNCLPEQVDTPAMRRASVAIAKAYGEDNGA